MKFLALLTPAAMLAVLWALERLEVWMNHPPGHIRRRALRRLPAGQRQPLGRHGGLGSKP